MLTETGWNMNSETGRLTHEGAPDPPLPDIGWGDASMYTQGEKRQNKMINHSKIDLR